MATTIKPIEAKSVHQIQSGQVIVDLCSVVKELVENGVDAGATSIEVRFRNYGLEAIEVQDNGSGIAPANYESLALKHYTSKLSNYDDLSQLTTFGFRGEALSSLCALSKLSVVTAQASEAPRGARLEFEISGKLKSSTTTPTQRGTTVIVEDLFVRLPVRQKELAKNIKREYGKVIGLLHSYACISTNLRFVVKNSTPKSKNALVFSTQSNATVRDNVVNVYGAKTLAQLVDVDLMLDFAADSTSARRNTAGNGKVRMIGLISKPVWGEGRQTPDRQMVFVNGRPCGLPQIIKAINEVYKGFNASQSPFICCDFRMDTNAYDVNVSPDKRTIFIHDAAALTDRLKELLTEKFDGVEQTVPQSQAGSTKLPAFRQLKVSRTTSVDSNTTATSIPSPKDDSSGIRDANDESLEPVGTHQDLMRTHFAGITSTREEGSLQEKSLDPEQAKKAQERYAESIAKAIGRDITQQAKAGIGEHDDVPEARQVDDLQGSTSSTAETPVSIHVRDFNARMQESAKRSSNATENDAFSEQEHLGAADERTGVEKGFVTPGKSRTRQTRLSPDIATITVGGRTVTKIIGGASSHLKSTSRDRNAGRDVALSQFSQRLQRFGANSRANTSIAARGERDDATTTEPNDQDRPEEDEDDLSSTHSPKSAKGNLESTDAFDREEERARVQALIRQAEATGEISTQGQQKRINTAFTKSRNADATMQQIASLAVSESILSEQARELARLQHTTIASHEKQLSRAQSLSKNDEEKLALTIAKSDFPDMHIVGQFNLGFIIAVRRKDDRDGARRNDELFIIDQHASDEIYNFERLQSETIVGSQKLVNPVMLELTAVEEEIVLENEYALEKNGFIIETDTSGLYPVGRRCALASLPLSKETTFGLKDLEELIHLLGESHMTSGSTSIARPSKVRKMFAMRACRSSIMIGRTLSMRQMSGILKHMGTMNKPWNCPHGRPTMRHLTSLDNLDGNLWREGDGLIDSDDKLQKKSPGDVWGKYLS